jgi:hypothetical protein
MPELAIYTVFVTAGVFMLGANCLWFWMKSINRSKGYQWDFVGHLRDFRNFRQIIADEKDPDNRKEYEAILLICRICILAAAVCIVVGGVLIWISEAPLRR